jgi:hypothetical protein
MSKWSNARCKAAALCLALAPLGACDLPQMPSAGDGGSASAATATSAGRVDAVPVAEPGQGRMTWRAADSAAQEATGNLRISRPERVRTAPLAMAFANGVTVLLSPPAMNDSDEASGSGATSFASLMGVAPRIDVYVFPVLEETVARSASQGGLCGSRRTTYVAATEYVDASGDWVLRLSAFAGAARPGGQEGDPDYCRSYTFRTE